jgi:hypothetical protein
MRFISTRAHGMLDWLMGALLLALPYLIGLDRDSAEGLLPMVLGLATILLTFFTNYELGVVRRVPVPTHLAIDAANGALLALSPWLFGFSNRVWMPHLILGLVELGTSFMTQLRPADRAQTTGKRR